MKLLSHFKWSFQPTGMPYTFIDLWGPETTTYIICQGINVCISCGLLHTSQTIVSAGCLGDSIVIWRAWVAWGRQLPVVLVPVILLVGVGRTF